MAEEHVEHIQTDNELLNSDNDRSAMESALTAHLDKPDPNAAEEIETTTTEKTNEQDNKSQSEERPSGDDEGDTSGKDKSEEKPKDEKIKTDEKEDDGGRPRNKIGQAIDKKEEGEKKSADKTKEEELDDFEKEIESFHLRTGASEKSVSALGTLKKKAREEHRARIEFEKKATEAEQKAKELEGRSMTPEREKEFEELRNFRKYIDIESDPEFNQEHTKAIADSQDSIMGLLKSWQLPEPMAKYILDNGGPYEFSASDRYMPANFKNGDGTHMTQSQWWADQIEGKLKPEQKRSLEYSLLQHHSKLQAKNDAIRNARANREAIIKDRTEKSESSRKEYIDKVQAHIPVVMQEIGIEDLKIKEVPKDATPAQRKEIEQHNKDFKEAQGLAQKFMIGATAEDKVEAAIWATYGKLLAGKEKSELVTKNKELTAEVDKLTKQLTDIKNASKGFKKNSAPPHEEGKKIVAESSESASDRMAKMMDERFK